MAILVMQKSQSHGALKVSEAVVVGVDEVKGQRPLDRTTASAWRGTYKAGPITINSHHITNQMILRQCLGQWCQPV